MRVPFTGFHTLPVTEKTYLSRARLRVYRVEGLGFIGFGFIGFRVYNRVYNRV